MNILLIFISVLYFAPSLWAAHKNKRRFIGLLLVNAFLGWTGIGWIVCLVWAIKEKEGVGNRSGKIISSLIMVAVFIFSGITADNKDNAPKKTEKSEASSSHDNSDEETSVKAEQPKNQVELNKKESEVRREEEPDSWIIHSDKSPIDDSKSVTLRLVSKETFQDQYGSIAVATLNLQCSENRTSIYIDMGGYFLADIQGYGNVITRIDSQKAHTYHMRVSTDNKALGLWYGGSSIPFINKLVKSKLLTVRVTPYNESSITVTFDTHGLNNYLPEFRNACHW
ncbi:type VI secretion system-associated protein TagO [Carnimonas bestiolae]|uniref:type VI secretion system-associated protein TagO n=1 Tax=Carnimonas bestiolae TaxID=3402172 RepID=UPI003EDBDE83